LGGGGGGVAGVHEEGVVAGAEEVEVEGAIFVVEGELVEVGEDFHGGASGEGGIREKRKIRMRMTIRIRCGSIAGR
jgi:hypothetical protein